MNAMLLAAGRSTRLGALGAALPKPLLPICGHPAITFGLRACARAGLGRVVVNLHHHGDLIRRALGGGAAAGPGAGVHIAYSDEPELLGTGGGIAQARPLFSPGPVLVMNAKVVAELDVAALLAAHAAGGGEATMLLRDDPDPRRWGAIAADSTGRVVGILDARSPIPADGPVVERMFTGVHVLEPALLDRLRPVFSDVIRDAYIPALLAGAVMRAVPLAGYFAEHSTPERYLAGNLALLRAPHLVSHPPGPLVGADPRATVHATARLLPPFRIEALAVVEENAVVGPEVALSSNTRVAAGTRVQHAVVWPGATVTSHVDHAVVTPEGVVQIP